mgnify:CR=1 FL=1
MLSLENALNLDEVKKYIEKISRYLNIKNQFIELIAEPKIDGLSIALKYKKGKFISGATRGDGQIGEDVTLNLNTVKNIPKEIPQLVNVELFEVRGEIYMKKDDFLNLNNKRKKNKNNIDCLKKFFVNFIYVVFTQLKVCIKNIINSVYNCIIYFFLFSNI